MEREELPLEIGEIVKYNDYAAGAGVSGVIVEHLGEDYMRVKWGDLPGPTTHRSHSLRRVSIRQTQI
jgi:hypothetical protein